MHEITGLELGLAIGELKGRVVGSYLKKFYDLGGGSFRFSMHDAEGNFVIYCSLLNALSRTGFVEESGQATGFAVAVRKRIEDSRVTAFYQHSSDRIAVLEVSARGARHRLVMEMFAKGNLILIDENDMIELCYKSVSYKDRDVRPKAKYEFPKSGSVDLGSMDGAAVDAILEKVEGSGSKMITELSKYLNVGPVYLEDIIVSAGLDPRERLAGEGTRSLKASILSFLEKIRSPSPVVYMKEGAVTDYSVFPLAKYGGFESVPCSSISDMFDRISMAARTAAKAEPQGNDTEEIDAVIAKQEALVREFSEGSAGYAESARRIFARMGELNALILRLKETRKPELGTIRDEFPELGVSELNLKDRKVAVEL